MLRSMVIIVAKTRAVFWLVDWRHCKFDPNQLSPVILWDF